MEVQVAQLSSAVQQLQEQLVVNQQAQQMLQSELLSSNQQLAATQQQLSDQHRLLEQASRVRGQFPSSLKLPKPATFSGHKRDPTPQNWVHCMENYLLANNVDLSGVSSVQLAAGYLVDSALTWYRLHLAEVDRGTTLPYADWHSFKEALLKKFVVVAPETLARTKLYTIKQTTSVRAYATEYNLCMLDIPDMTEKDRVDRFLRGLKADIRVLVELQKPPTLVEAVELATQIDSIMWQSRKGSFRNPLPHTRPQSASGPMPMELGAAESKFRIRGRQSAPRGSFQRSYNPARAPPGKADESASGRGPIRCFYCKQMGPLARNCYRRRKDMTSGTRRSPSSS
jgi:hypothetical protein